MLTLTLTRDNETGEAQVSDYAYAPMYMLHRAEGASPRFELVDIRAALDSGETGDALGQKLTKALETCRAVFGEEPNR